jgi:hypothetical protein
VVMFFSGGRVQLGWTERVRCGLRSKITSAPVPFATRTVASEPPLSAYWGGEQAPDASDQPRVASSWLALQRPIRAAMLMANEP